MVDFEGKFLVIHQKNNKEHAAYLENVRIKMIGDNAFLVGDFIKVEYPVFKDHAGITY